MKTKFAFIILITTLFFIACKDNEDIKVVTPGSGPTDEEYTNQWIYDIMSRIYLWNDELPASPDYTQNPENFFYTILYKYGELSGDRFSWIEEDKSKKTAEDAKAEKAKALYTDVSLGFDCLPMPYFPKNEQNVSSSIGLFVITVNEKSDAQAKGLRRGQVIYQVNNTDVDYENYKTILDNLTSCTLGVYNKDGKKEVLETFSASAPSPSPVFISKVITLPNVKIAYLMYNAFERNSTDTENSYEYDIELIQSIQNLKEQGITEFVLDLRYNPGGYLTSAMDLASALVPNRSAENIFVKEQYNAYYTDSLRTKYGENAFNEYFLDKVYGTGVEIPELNLSRLYVIATDYTASASELIIHGLRPYMDVIHIGLTTVGKDKGSQTIKNNDKRVLWQLQPIISRLTDAKGTGNYISGLEPNHEISEWAEGYQMVDAYYVDENGSTVDVQLPLLSVWKGGLHELGDPSEPLLATAIEQITGISHRKSLKTSVQLNWAAKRVPRIEPWKKKAITLIDK
jgi:C-terminal processing protease CtpA/Prc